MKPAVTNDKLFLGMYWGARRESIATCAKRLGVFFSALTEEPKFAEWYELGSSRKEALSRPVDVLDAQSVRRLLAQGRHYTDQPRRWVKELGFSLGLWNGKSGKSGAILMANCGSYSEVGGNFVTLKLPTNLGRLKCAEQTRPFFEAAVRAWQPEWAGLMSETAMQKRGFNAAKPFVDWIVYINRDWMPEPPPLASPATVTKLPNGTLVVTQETPPDPTSAAQQRRVLRVARTLQAAMTTGEFEVDWTGQIK